MAENTWVTRVYFTPTGQVELFHPTYSWLWGAHLVHTKQLLKISTYCKGTESSQPTCATCAHWNLLGLKKNSAPFSDSHESELKHQRTYITYIAYTFAQLMVLQEINWDRFPTLKTHETSTAENDTLESQEYHYILQLMVQKSGDHHLGWW